MSASLRLDHVVIKVDDLAEAVDDFARLGFAVSLGGRHETWESTNAIVPLADGSYLELIAFSGSDGHGDSMPARFRDLRRQGRSRIECRVLSWSAAPEGFVDLSLLPTQTAEELDRLRRVGLDYEGPLPGMRLRPDAQEVRWQMGLPAERDLPFLCGDVTPRSLRVPAASDHANGVCGVAEVTIVVDDVTASRRRYQLLLGADSECDASGGTDGETSVAAFRCGATAIRLAASADPGSPLSTHLRHRGPTPYRIRLCVREGHDRPFEEALLHGAAMEPAPSSPDPDSKRDSQAACRP